MGTPRQKIEDLLSYAIKLNASDIHFRVGSPPAFRKSARLANVKMPPFTAELMNEVVQYLLPLEATRQKFLNSYEIDGSFDFQGKCRFRFNLFKVDGTIGAVMRLVPLKIPTLTELHYSNVIKQMSELQRALVLVTGSTGSGKSTTLAAMIDHLNENFPMHIITIEDPIEFVHKPKRARITQREIGRDTGSFSDALRAALRQDPDVILVGEMRDTESIEMAIKAAETGHTVFSTIHTTDAQKTINRLISMFPSDEQHEVRYRLADCLKATLSQRLLPRADGQGLVCAQEIMLTNTAISECIADPARTGEIPKFIELGRDVTGMQTFDQHLRDLFSNEIITLDTAKKASSNGADFERNLHYSQADAGWSESAVKQGSRSIPTQDGMKFTRGITPHEAKKPSARPERASESEVAFPQAPPNMRKKAG